MKQTLIFLIAAALPASAQWRHFGDEPATPTGYFGIGFSTPVNPLATQLDAGWNLAGGVGMTTQYVGIMLDAMYTNFGITSTALTRAGFTGGGQKYWAVTVNPVFHVNQRGPIDFYVTAGAGLYDQITDYRVPAPFLGPFGGPSDVISSYSLYKGGVNGGAGFSFNIGYHSNVKVFVEARYHHMYTRTPGASFIPVTIGIRF